MIEDKCPTCPMYGKGYCDCGKSKYKTTWNFTVIVLVAIVFFSGVLKLISLIKE